MSSFNPPTVAGLALAAPFLPAAAAAFLPVFVFSFFSAAYKGGQRSGFDRLLG